MNIPNKCAKYGLNIVMVFDSGTKYMIDASAYLRKKTRIDNMPLEEYYVKTLTTTLRGPNTNIKMDNWFPSVKVADDLLQDPYKFTMVGTLRKNKREIPSQMLLTQNRQPGDARYCFDEGKTLLSYVPKKNKDVILSSTVDSGTTLTSETTGEPDVIDFYNSAKVPPVDGKPMQEPPKRTTSQICPSKEILMTTSLLCSYYSSSWMNTKY
nr:unnamed protein product [Callosobruchus analis]